MRSCLETRSGGWVLVEPWLQIGLTALYLCRAYFVSEHLVFLTVGTGWRWKVLEKSHCAYPSTLARKTPHGFGGLFQSLTVLAVERFFVICDSNHLCWQVFFSFWLWTWKTHFSLYLCCHLLYTGRLLSCCPSVSSSEQAAPLCCIFPHKLWVEDLCLFSSFSSELSPIGPWLSQSVMPAGECSAPRGASLALSKMLVALRVLQTLLLLKYRSMAFTFFSAAYYCHCTLSLWSTAPSPLISFLLSCFPANCSLFTACAS